MLACWHVIPLPNDPQGPFYTRTASAHLELETTLGYVRSTPVFPPSNQTQPALKFADGLYGAFNAPGGTITGAYGNVFQARQTVAYTSGKHAYKAGFEVWANRDTTVFGLAPNGEYTFGGGTVHTPVAIESVSGRHQILPGDTMPDSLSALLTATAFSYDISVSPRQFPQGDHNRFGLRCGAKLTTPISRTPGRPSRGSR